MSRAAQIKESFEALAMLAFGLLWGFGGIAGAIYWALKGKTAMVVLSLFVPLSGPISMAWCSSG